MDLGELRRCQGLAAAGGGREAGRQLGVVGRTFLSPSLANPIPVSKLRSRVLACCVTERSQPAVGGRKGSLLLAGNRERGEDSEGSLTPPRRKSSSVHPWGQRRLSWESSGDYTPTPHRIEALRPREALGLSRDTAANQLPTLTPILISWQLQSESLLDLPLSSQAHLSLQKEKYLDPEAKFLFPSPGTRGPRDTPLTHPTPPHPHTITSTWSSSCCGHSARYIASAQ